MGLPSDSCHTSLNFEEKVLFNRGVDARSGNQSYCFLSLLLALVSDETRTSRCSILTRLLSIHDRSIMIFALAPILHIFSKWQSQKNISAVFLSKRLILINRFMWSISSRLNCQLPAWSVQEFYRVIVNFLETNRFILIITNESHVVFNLDLWQ
jgi:hypothetical protein